MKLLKKITDREFWPWYVLYTPVYFIWLRNGLKTKNMMYPYAANPGMPPVRPLQFSKWQILQQIDEVYLPQTFLVSQQTPPETYAEYLEQLDYKAIIKPDVGERGDDVKKINSVEQLATYLEESSPGIYLLQEFNNDPLEFGVMRYRYPGETRGHISGIVQKVPLCAIGDGSSTIEQLILADERLAKYEQLFRETQQEYFNTILDAGQKHQLSDIGNHCK